MPSFAEEFSKGFRGTMSKGGSRESAEDKAADKEQLAKTGKAIKTGVQDVGGALASGARKVAGMFKKGGKVPKTGNYKLHRGETVVPAGMARGLERLGKKGPSKVKPKKVSLGKKGGFTIKHPGVFKAAAKRAGMSTRAYAQKKKSAPGVLGRRARSALGLMAMGQ